MALGLVSPDPTRRPRRRPDLVLVGATAALVAVGLVAVSVATAGRIAPTAPHVVRQSVAVLVGTAVAGALATAGHRRSAVLAPVLYATTVVLLGLVLVVAPPVNGARAWLQVGALQFQPSELAKVAVVMILAAIVEERREAAATGRGVMVVVAVAAVPMALILAQPDFGTFLVFATLVGVLLTVAGARAWHLGVLVVAGLAAVALAWQAGLVSDYQVARLTVFLDGGADPGGAGYNAAQAQIAVGAGGLFGAAPRAGEQTALGYVPEHHTDFVFTVVAEHTGFAGAAALLGLYALVLWRGLGIAADAPDRLGALLASGGVAVIAVQVIVGVGMTVGLAPVVGLPLPFVSYGGTHVIASLALIGLMVAVQRADPPVSGDGGGRRAAS